MDLASPFCFRPPETWHVPYPRHVKKGNEYVDFAPTVLTVDLQAGNMY
jgi:hypothetical protein